MPDVGVCRGCIRIDIRKTDFEGMQDRGQEA